MNRHQQLWNECLSIIKDNISETPFESWFKPIEPIGFNGKELILQIPSMFFLEFLEENYSRILRKSVDKVIGQNVKILYNVKVTQGNGGTTDIPADTKEHSSIIENNGPKSIYEEEQNANEVFDCHLNPRYTFDNFIEGESNRLARCAGLNISVHPGDTVFNPIFIYGEPAVGKTHLASAIGIAIKQRYAKKKVLYISAHLFQMQYGDSVATRKTNDFINFYQSIDVLIIDDIQELIGKQATQNTFFYILNHLLLIGKQIIICCDREPGKLEGMEQRLVTRFKMGLNVEIEKPNYDLRKKILEHKIFVDGLPIGEEVVDYIAQHVTSSVRELEGTIASLMAHSTFMNADINIDLAKKVIGTPVLRESDGEDSQLDKILDIVCEDFGVEKDELMSKNRARKLSEARQIAMYLARTQTNISLTIIGQRFGKRDHTTVLYAYKQILGQMDVDTALRARIRKMERKFNE